jgi:hypothetical protein
MALRSMNTIYAAITTIVILILLAFNIYVPNKYYEIGRATLIKTAYNDEKVMREDAEYFKNNKDCEFYRKSNKWHPMKLRIISVPWNVCTKNQGSDLELFVYLYMRLNSFEARNHVRQTWANRELFPELNVAFILGSSPNASLNERVTEENRIHGDILQGDFIDVYRNLTFKSQMTFRWVKHSCMNAKLVAKMDGTFIAFF